MASNLNPTSDQHGLAQLQPLCCRVRMLRHSPCCSCQLPFACVGGGRGGAFHRVQLWFPSTQVEVLAAGYGAWCLDASMACKWCTGCGACNGLGPASAPLHATLCRQRHWLESGGRSAVPKHQATGAPSGRPSAPANLSAVAAELASLSQIAAEAAAPCRH